MIKDKLLKYIGKNLSEFFNLIDKRIFEEAEEIRIRLNKSILIKTRQNEYILLKNGKLEEKSKKEQDFYLPNERDLKQTIEAMSNYSIYAYEQEIKNGFITLNGGFRVGLAGKIVLENGQIKAIKNISSLNIRIAREIKGCSKGILKYIADPNVKNTMIASPPNAGKTTLLRDLILNLSELGFNVAVVDERSEIAGSHLGQSQMDLGFRTDILDSCPKAEGMILLLKSMSPNVIAVDEIGTLEDAKAIERVSNSGVSLICTVHCESLEELKNKEVIKDILKSQIFERFIFLTRKNGAGTIKNIYNKKFEEIYR